MIFLSYINELGARLSRNAQVLAKRVVAGTTENVPFYGFDLLKKLPEAALPVLTDALQDPETAKRDRAIMAIGDMGRAAIGAKEKVEAARATADPREAVLLDDCLRQIGAK
jgi:hypothetical protein